MLRTLSTYLLFIITCSFFMMGLNELYLDNSVKIQNNRIATYSVKSSDNFSFTNAKGNTLPVKENALINNFDFENEVEVEVDVLPTMEFTICNFTFNNSECLFLNVYSTYSFTTIKVEFLDIFSPPPNC